MPYRTKKVGKYQIKIVDDGKNALNNSDIEMDIRAVEAVRAAINKARICKKPIAKYDKATKRAYLEYANGEIKYVN